jgi:hypothetical protein
MICAAFARAGEALVFDPEHAVKKAGGRSSAIRAAPRKNSRFDFRRQKLIS